MKTNIHSGRLIISFSFRSFRKKTDLKKIWVNKYILKHILNFFFKDGYWTNFARWRPVSVWNTTWVIEVQDYWPFCRSCHWLVFEQSTRNWRICNAGENNSEKMMMAEQPSSTESLTVLMHINRTLFSQ